MRCGHGRVPALVPAVTSRTNMLRGAASQWPMRRLMHNSPSGMPVISRNRATIAAERSSRRSDRAPRVANLGIEMIGSGGPARTDQKRLDARIDHEPGFFLLVELQAFENFDHSGDRHLLGQVTGDRRRKLGGAVAVRGHDRLSASRWVR